MMLNKHGGTGNYPSQQVGKMFAIIIVRLLILELIFYFIFHFLGKILNFKRVF